MPVTVQDATIGRRARKKGLTRQALLDAALRHFGERGIYQTRLEDITETADIAKAAFYTYFQSKDALVAELLSEGVDLLSRQYLQTLDAPGSADRVRALVRQHNAFFDDHPRYEVVFHQARGLLHLRGRGERRLAEVFARYLDVIARTLVPSGRWTDATVLRQPRLAAAVAGAIAGARSFGLSPGTASQPLVEELMTIGVPALLADDRPSA